MRSASIGYINKQNTITLNMHAKYYSISEQGINVNEGNIDQYVHINPTNGLRIDLTGSGQFFAPDITISNFDIGSIDVDNALNMLNDGNLIL